jgi:uncharacterized membrane protein
MVMQLIWVVILIFMLVFLFAGMIGAAHMAAH